MDVESLWYDVFPFVRGLGGVFVLYRSTGSGLLKCSGLLLIVASVTIVRQRWRHRRALFVDPVVDLTGMTKVVEPTAEA